MDYPWLLERQHVVSTQMSGLMRTNGAPFAFNGDNDLIIRWKHTPR